MIKRIWKGIMMITDIIKNYKCSCVQEIQDQKIMIDFIDLCHGNILTRENPIAHMTASSMIFNKDRSKVLMVYHHIYDSWSWTGGHADGCGNLSDVAVREAKEETGIKELRFMNNEPVSLDILQVVGHIKNMQYISPHLHFNLTYALEADESEVLRCKPDENSDVRWIPVRDLTKFVSETHMVPVYKKILERCGRYKESRDGKFADRQ